MTRISPAAPSAQQDFIPWEKNTPGRSPEADVFLAVPANPGILGRLRRALNHPTGPVFQSVSARTRPAVYPGFQNLEIGNGRRLFYRVTDDGQLIIGGSIAPLSEFLAIAANSNVHGDFITTDFTSLESDAAEIESELRGASSPIETTSFTVTPRRDATIMPARWVQIRAKRESGAAQMPAPSLYGRLLERFVDAMQRRQFETQTVDTSFTAQRLNIAMKHVAGKTEAPTEVYKALGRRPLFFADGPAMPWIKLPQGVVKTEVGIIFSADASGNPGPTVVVRFKRYEFEEGGGISSGAMGHEADASEWRGIVSPNGLSIKWTMTNTNPAYTHPDLREDALTLVAAFADGITHEFPDPYKGFGLYLSQSGESLRFKDGENSISIVGDRYALARFMTLLEGANDYSHNPESRFDPNKAGRWVEELSPSVGYVRVAVNVRFGDMTGRCFVDTARDVYELCLSAPGERPWLKYLDLFHAGTHREITSLVTDGRDGNQDLYSMLETLMYAIENANAIDRHAATRLLKNRIFLRDTILPISGKRPSVFAGVLTNELRGGMYQGSDRHRSRIEAFRFIAKHTGGGLPRPVENVATWTGWIRDGRNVEWEVSDTNPEFAAPEIRARFFEEIIRPTFRKDVGHFAMPPSDSGPGTSVAGLRPLPPEFETPIDLGMGGGGMMTLATLPLMAIGTAGPALGAQTFLRVL